MGRVGSIKSERICSESAATQQTLVVESNFLTHHRAKKPRIVVFGSLDQGPWDGRNILPKMQIQDLFFFLAPQEGKEAYSGHPWCTEAGHCPREARAQLCHPQGYDAWNAEPNEREPSTERYLSSSNVESAPELVVFPQGRLASSELCGARVCTSKSQRAPKPQLNQELSPTQKQPNGQTVEKTNGVEATPTSGHCDSGKRARVDNRT